MIARMRTGAFVLAVEIVRVGLASGLEARELPRGQAAPRLRTGCESFGPDFHKIDGSDTCIRISGSAEVEAVLRTGSGAGASFFPGTGKR